MTNDPTHEELLAELAAIKAEQQARKAAVARQQKAWRERKRAELEAFKARAAASEEHARKLQAQIDAANGGPI